MTRRLAQTVLLGGLALALGCERRASPPFRLIVLGLDGVDPAVVAQMVSEGKLPHFARLRAEGASGRLRVDGPLLSPIIWTTLATGRPAVEHGIGHFTAQVGEGGEEIPVTSSMRRVKAVWNIFAEARKEVAVVGWWATWPAESLQGTVVSDHLFYHFLSDVQEATDSEDGLVSPPEELAAIRGKVRPTSSLTASDLEPFVATQAIDLERPFDFRDNLSHLRWAVAAAESYRVIGLDLWQRRRPDLLMVYFEGVDTVSHLFGHLHRRRDLAGELAEQQRVYGRAVEGMYRLADAIVGDYLAALDERTTLVVLSDHGFALGELPDDPSTTRELRRVSERHHREEAIFFLFGAGVAPGHDLGELRPLDVTPTLLALAGLPVARDMPGRVLDIAGGRRELPRIVTYETGTRTGTAAGPRESVADRALVEKLTALGYLGGPRSAGGDRNLAFLALQEGRPAEAARQFAALLAGAPDDAALETGLASALGDLGRSEEALAHFARALELDPLLVVAHHNRGLLFERLGRLEEAIADYRTAVSYDPGYEPPRLALRRLQVNPGRWEPASADEQRASALVEKAGQAMRRGDYPQARTLLDEAVRLAPGASAVHQQIANVAYLSGDFALAIAATERALELDPGNARLRANLESLRRRPGGK